LSKITSIPSGHSRETRDRSDAAGRRGDDDGVARRHIGFLAGER
jgi:hypothetical protein